MKNLTITVPEEVAAWARVWAAKHNTSVSKLVGEMLRERMQQEDAYEAAMRSFLARKPTVLSGAPYPKREELYDRPRLR
ncbi:MAG: DUF6364 family protein [Myxococcota bacterium]